MEWYKTMIALGFPTLFAAVACIAKKLVKVAGEIDIFKEAIQNQLRSDMIKDAKQYIADGNLTELELYDWQHRYESYHKLGKNGVMDAFNEKVINLAVNN